MLSQIIASQFLASLSVMGRATYCNLGDQRYRNDPAFVIARLARSILDSLCQDLHTNSWNPNLFCTTDVNKRVWRHFSPKTLCARGANDDHCTTEFCTNVHLCIIVLGQGPHQNSFNFACGNVIGSEQLLPRHLSLVLSCSHGIPWQL